MHDLLGRVIFPVLFLLVLLLASFYRKCFCFATMIMQGDVEMTA